MQRDLVYILTAIAALSITAGQAFSQSISAVDEVNFEIKCENAARKHLADPPTFQLDRRTSLEVERNQSGLLFWIFDFDGATKRGNVGHFAAACEEQISGDVKLTVR